ncbi:sugar-binding domain-containing protein [Faecalimonas sp.]
MNKFTKRTARFGATLLTTVLTMSCFAPLATANASVEVRTQSQTQMSSEKEVVYVNTIDNTTERTQNFDANWKFYLGDAGNAQTSNFDDSKWRNISLPHDYSIEQEYSKQMEAESGYLPGGIGWYRKHFTVGNELQGKEIRLDFDGVYMNSTVYINGQELGTHPYGYTPFSFDLTKHIKFGEENVISVKVDHKTPSSRWYSGSGIYRSVNLTVTDAVNVALNGTKVETPELATNQTQVKTKVRTTVENDSTEAKDVVLTHKVFEKGKPESVIGEKTTEKTTIQSKQKVDVSTEFNVSSPKLWDTEHPNLYTVRTEVKVGDKVVDTYDTEYGFRYTEFKKDTGFYLNGKAVKLKGVCMHHDQGALGAVANRRAIERQVEILQEMGCNSIRVTHNPAAQNLIDVCNEKGILVVEEIFDGWHHAKNGNTEDFAKYFDKQVGADNKVLGATPNMTWAEFSLKSTLKRDQNAPSVIMWSLGNEIQEGNYKSGFLERTPNMIRWAQEIDTTKEITIGSNAVKNEGVNGEHSRIADKITEAGGVSGTNYSDGNSYDNLRRLHPNWKIYGSETASSVNSRGVYHTKGRDNNTQELSSYDTSKVNWGAFASDAWYDVITRDFVAGTYVWTGFDYIGEPTHWNGTNPGVVGKWPSPKNSFFGIIDTAGMPKDSYYLYQSQWNDKVNTLHVLPTWDEDEIILNNQNKAEVVVYSDAPKVELWFTPTGSKEAKKVGETQELETRTTEKAKHSYQVVKGTNKLYRTWNVPFEEGKLEARAFDENNQRITETEGRSSVTTTGTKAKLQVKVDRTEIKANGKDLSYLQIDVVDANGNIVPNAADKVRVEVTGNGTLVGLDNGWQTDHDSYKGTERRVYNGSGIAIVQSTKNAGDITVKVSAEGLEGKTVTLKTKADTTGEQQQAVVDSFFMSKNYYVKVGNKPSLPEQIEVRYSDGKKEQKSVKWNTITTEQINKAGAFTVDGIVDGKYKVSVRVNMIDEVGGLLNYSTATKVGTVPKLPEARTAYLSNGEVLDVAFPVKWEEKTANDYNKEGTVTVNGTANVLGKDVKVTATVRVAKEDVALGDSVSGAAVVLEQDIPENMQSDTLAAIKDGNTGKDANNQGGTNNSVWTNYKNSNDGNDNTAEIIMGYDTQVVLGEIVIHFFEDSYSARYPDPNKTEIYVAETKNGPWTQVQVKEQIGTAKDGIKAYTYKLDAPVSATFIKFKLTNKDEQLEGRKPCTGITEIELKKATTSFKTNTTAELNKLSVNGVELTQEQLVSGKYTTSALIADVVPETKDNAAVTVLPKNKENQVKIIIESEDHKTTKTFTIFLNDKEPDVFYPNENITPSAPFSLPNPDVHEGDVRYVLDGKLDTHWHTNWRNTDASDIKNREITLTLKEATTIDAMNYYPRVYGGGNGRVTKYKILYSVDGTTFKDTDVCAEGTISKDKADWTLLEFTKPVKAKAFKLVGVETYADSGNNKHMAVAELRLRMQKETTDISNAENKVVIAPIAKQKVDVVDENHPVEPQVTVKQNGTALTYGVDYKVSYANNTAVGTAKAIVTGIGKYSGTLETTFEIEKNLVSLKSIAVKTTPKQDYHVGDKFNPEGLVLTVFYSDATSSEVAYTAETKGEFTFAPSLEKALATTDKVVTVTYEGKSTEIPVNVTEGTTSSVRKSLEERVKFAQTITPNGYTTDSYKAFKDALKVAEAMLANTNATEAQLQTALDNLNVGINGLKEEAVNPNPNPNPKPDNAGEHDELRAKLQKFYDECLTYYKEDNYSKTNWNRYQDAMAQTKEVLEDKEATENELKDALSKLIDATKRLNAEGKGEGNSPTPPTNVKTGDQAPITMIIVLMVVAVVAIAGVIIYKRKRK